MFLDDALTDQIHLQKTTVSTVCPEKSQNHQNCQMMTTYIILCDTS